MRATVQPESDPLAALWSLDPYSPDFQPTAERFLCSRQTIADVGQSSDKSGEALLAQWVLWRYFRFPLSLDGEFGPSTREAVETFQSSHGLPMDGLVGPATWLVLRHNACDD